VNPSALHVLIVDDSPEDRMIVRRLLSRSAPWAYTLTEVDRGGLALAACQATRPDCVLLDHNLPDMDGLEVLAALRTFTDVPVVVLTGTSNVAQTETQPSHDRLSSLAKGTLTAERLSLTIQRAVANVRLARARALDLALFTTMVDTIPVCVSMLDPELRIIQVNAAMAAMLGHPAAALRGQWFAERWPDLAQSLAPRCAQVLATGQPTDSYALLALSPDAGATPRIWHVSMHLLALPGTGAPGLCLVLHTAGAV
jgi:CheY-like chemotaxis protein